MLSLLGTAARTIDIEARVSTTSEPMTPAVTVFPERTTPGGVLNHDSRVH